jgi:hypothetical protein
MGGIVGLPAEEQEKIKNTKSVPPHFCCSNPYWLYRIFQDTRVHITEVLGIIQDALDESKILLKDHAGKNPKESYDIKVPKVNRFECLNGPSRPNGALWVSV